MTEPAGGDGLVDTETALNHQVEALCQRFPEVPRNDIDRRIHRAYDELRRNARVQSHLISLCSAQVTEELLRHRHAA
jgi:hypothetical protein